MLPSPAVSKPRVPEIWLPTKVCAALVGLSVFTLQRARHDRPDLHAPPAVRIGTRTIRYALTDVLLWAYSRKVVLHWSALPFSFALPAAEGFDALGLSAPADLAGLVRRGRA